MNSIDKKDNVSINKYILHTWKNDFTCTIEKFNLYTSAFEKEHKILENQIKQLKGEIDSEILIYSNNQKEKALIAWIIKGINSKDIDDMDDEDLEKLKAKLD